MPLQVYKGFTLIEVMIVIFIISIVMSIALPRLQGVSNSINFDSIQRSLISSLFFARAEAMKQGGNVTVCPSSDSATCLATSNSWNDGWIIFLDVDANGVLDAGTDQLIKVVTIPRVANLTWTGTRSITFRGEGDVLAGAQGNLRICDINGDISIVRGIAVNISGRVAENNAVTCP